WNYALSLLLGLFLSVLYIAQYIYHLFFKTPLLVFSIFNGAQVAEFADETGRMILSHLPQILLFLLPLLCLAIFGLKAFRRSSWQGSLLLLLLSFMMYTFALYALPFSGTVSPNSAYNCYYNENNPLPTQQKLGVLTFMGLDSSRTLCGFTPKDAPALVQLPSPEEEEGEAALENGNPGPKSDLEQVKREEEKNYGYNQLDIDFAALLAEEQDPDLQNMHHYFSALEPSSKNEYTGKYAGKNLIVITAEGFYYPLLETGLFPSIKRLATEGFEFTNSYTPLWNVSTSDGEYVVLNSLMPASGVWSFARSAENYLPFALGNQFAALGYESIYAFHNHSYDYYERDLSHPNHGYTYLGRGNGLEITEQWPESDVELIEASLPYYIDSESFHVYFLTVSGHLEYNFSGNNMAAKHRETVEDLDYSEEVKAYIACNLELEYAVEMLLEQLKARNLLEETVIVFSADHYPYGLSEAGLDELVGHPVEKNFELYRNTIAIWNGGQEHEVIDAPISSMDILPTISNLFGLKYDSRFMMGRDVFSDSVPLVIFNNRSWITDQARYNATNEILEGEVTPEYAAAINEVVKGKFLYSADILFKDYYRMLFSETER
ncbi:MAG: LTA synthase family protein, partial [Bacillota bacterium]|nr:LTA synthase family protein [Bacillota bacterium]